MRINEYKIVRISILEIMKEDPTNPIGREIGFGIKYKNIVYFNKEVYPVIKDSKELKREVFPEKHANILEELITIKQPYYVKKSDIVIGEVFENREYVKKVLGYKMGEFVISEDFEIYYTKPNCYDNKYIEIIDEPFKDKIGYVRTKKIKDIQRG
jgi:hypothetical protein